MRLLRYAAFVLVASVLAVGAQEKTKPAQDEDKEKKKKDRVSISTGAAEIAVSAEGGVKINAGGVKIEVPKIEVPGGVGGGSGTATETDKEILISTSNQMLSYECKGRDVRIQGGSNAVTLRGTCREVSVNGMGNYVTVDAVDSISVQGTGNRLTWKRAVTGKTPRTTQSGTGNFIDKADADKQEEPEP